MLIIDDPGCDEIAKAARLQAWTLLQKLEADGFTPRQTAYYMSVVASSTLDMCITASAEAKELRIRRERSRTLSAPVEVDPGD